MRFKREKVVVGQRRTVVGFLWFPKVIDGETRWLEKARWIEAAVYDNEVGRSVGYKPRPKQLILSYSWRALRWA